MAAARSQVIGDRASDTLEDSHLCRGANCFVDWADGKEADRVAELLRHTSRPCLKLDTTPLKPVITMPELSGRQRVPDHVVLSIRRRQHDSLGFCELKQHSFQCRQPWRIQMLYHLNDRRRIESGQSFVPIDQRSVN